MISIEKLWKIKTIVTHAHCPDGMASAMILHDVLPKVNIIFLEHGSIESKELIPQEGMLFCDFCPKENVEEFIKNGAIVLDHHKSAREIIEAFGENGIFADEEKDIGIAGANLAFREIWLPLKNVAGTPIDVVERFQKLAGIRDTWQKDSLDWNESRYQSEILLFYPTPHWLSAKHPACITNSELALGKLLSEKHDEKIKHALKNVYAKEIFGLKIGIFNGNSIVSDASELLRQNGFDIIVGFSFVVENNQPKVNFSLRSNEKFDVGKFAKDNGGGGHTRAAGFGQNIFDESLNPYSYFTKLFGSYSYFEK